MKRSAEATSLIANWKRDERVKCEMTVISVGARVVIGFSEEIRWLQMTPAQAKKLIRDLREKIKEAEKFA